MRTPVALLIVLLLNGLWSVGAPACPAEADEPERHSHGSDEGAHPHGAAGHGPVAQRDARGSAGSAEDDPGCCRADPRAPLLAEAMMGSHPSGQLSLAMNPSPRIDPPRTPVLPSSARLRLGQPPPLPYERSRRPLVI